MVHDRFVKTKRETDKEGRRSRDRTRPGGGEEEHKRQKRRAPPRARDARAVKEDKGHLRGGGKDRVRARG